MNVGRTGRETALWLGQNTGDLSWALCEAILALVLPLPEGEWGLTGLGHVCIAHFLLQSKLMCWPFNYTTNKQTAEKLFTSYSKRSRPRKKFIDCLKGSAAIRTPLIVWLDQNSYLSIAKLIYFCLDVLLENGLMHRRIHNSIAQWFNRENFIIKWIAHKLYLFWMHFCEIRRKYWKNIIKQYDFI